jgi:IS5 family transposase
VPGQQLQGQLQTQHSADRADSGYHIEDKQNLKSKTNYRQAMEEKHINAEKVKKKINMKRDNKNRITKNYITQNIKIMNK